MECLSKKRVIEEKNRFKYHLPALQRCLYASPTYVSIAVVINPETQEEKLAQSFTK